MDAGPKRIISASRRTDIPAFYMDWFMERMSMGRFDVQNPFNRTRRQVHVSPQEVHAIVFWSKNFDPFLKCGAGEKLTRQGYRLYFNFTVNSPNTLLEPRVPPLQRRLSQLRVLCDIFGPRNVAWRFDPICHYTAGCPPTAATNLDQFARIAQAAADAGIKKCVTSFLDPYTKITRRIDRLKRTSDMSLVFSDPPLHQKTALIRNMARTLSRLGIGLHLCCEKQVFEALAPELEIRQNACIDGRLFASRTADRIVTKKDAGQRAAKGCQCTQSVDIGSYDDHPCRHNCIFCYARTQMDLQN